MKHSLLTFLLTVCATFIMSHTFGQEKYTPNPDRYKADYANMTQKDVDKLLKKTQKEKTREDAYRDLGLIYYYGNSNIPQDYTKAVEYLNKSFSFGKIIAASLYWKGAPGVQKDPNKAWECIKDIEDSEILRQEKTFLDFGAQDLYYKKMGEIDKMVKEMLSHFTKDKWKYATDYVKYNSPSAIKCLLEAFINGEKDSDNCPIPSIKYPSTDTYKTVTFTSEGIGYGQDRTFIKNWVAYLQKLLSNNPLNKIENAEDAYDQFKVGAITLKTFLNGIKTSSNQGEYAKYIPAAIFQSANKNAVTFYVGERIFLELAKDSLIENNVINTLGIVLCRITNNPEHMFEIFKKLRLDGKFHSYLNESLDCLISNDGKHNTNADEIKPFAGFAFYPDGRILMNIGKQYPYEDFYDKVMTIYWKNRKIWDAYGMDGTHYILYNPNGQSMYGVLNVKGYKTSYTVFNDVGPAYEYNLAAGYYLNNNGERTKECYAGYNSVEEVVAAQKADEKRIRDATEKRNNQIEKALVQKYGRKAYDAMNSMRPYEGMPEGIVREFRLSTQDKIFNTYGFARIVSGYKLYLPTSLFKLTAQILNLRYPKAIYVLNGKVAAVKW